MWPQHPLAPPYLRLDDRAHQFPDCLVLVDLLLWLVHVPVDLDGPVADVDLSVRIWLPEVLEHQRYRLEPCCSPGCGLFAEGERATVFLEVSFALLQAGVDEIDDRLAGCSHRPIAEGDCP